MNLLDADWRRSVWKRWLKSRLSGLDSAPPAPSAASAEVPPGTAASLASETQSVAPPAAVAVEPTIPPPATVPDLGTRRGEVRARFDALFDRLLSLEDTLDAFSKRFALRAVHDRRHDQQMLERLESASEALERQSLALEAATATLERVEQRVERLERWLRSEGNRDALERRESRIAPSRVDAFEELEQVFADPGSRSAVELEASGASAFYQASIRGNLTEMSLPTVLAMLELERRTGVLKVCAEDGSVVSATLRDGAIVGARARDLDADPVDAVREALAFQAGHFWFRQSAVEVASGPPRSTGSVLLEATRRNDEAVRSA